MAKFKITKSTTVAEIKEQFRSEFGGVLRVYEGRSEAPEDAALVSLGAKEGDLECRASRTVGKFEEAFQSELGLKVKVYTKDNWVSVLDGITLSTVRAIPKSATKAKMEQFLAYQRDEKEDVAEEAKADEVEIPEEIKGIPLFDIHMKKVEWPFMTEEEIKEHSDELGAFGIVLVSGKDEVGEFQNFVFVGDTDDGMYNALEFIEWCRNDYGFENFEAHISDFIKIYGLDNKAYELSDDIQQGMIAFTGSEYCYGNWALKTPALFRVQYDNRKPNVFSIDKYGYYGETYWNELFDKLVKLTENGQNELKPETFDPDDYYFDESGLAWVESRNGKRGLLDTKGNLIVDCVFDRTNDFEDGVAIVVKDDKWGLIDTKGNFVIDCIYDQIWAFDGGIASFKKDGKYGLIDSKGNLVVDCIYEGASVDGGVASVKKDGKYGLVDNKGNLIVDCIYDVVRCFDDGLAVVKKDGKRGFIDRKGNLVVDCIYEEAWDFAEGFASVQKDGKWGLIDTKGNLVIDCIYDEAFYFEEDLASVQKDGKYGFIDNKGNLVIKCIFDCAGNFSHGAAKVEKDGKEFKIDTKGNVVEDNNDNTCFEEE